MVEPGLLGLDALLGTTHGEALLRERGLFLSAADFVEALDEPVTPSGLGPPATRIVYTPHQLYADYPWSVVVKLQALAALPRRPDLALVAVWIDTDRCGADRYAVRMGWRHGDRVTRILVSPHAYDGIETRFAPIHEPTLHRAFTTLGESIVKLPRGRRAAAESRLAELHAVVEAARPATLAELNSVITRVLLTRGLGIELPPLLLSDILRAPGFIAQVTQFTNRLDEVVAVFNEAVRGLRGRGIDPQVKELPADYFPLRFSCPADGRRLRLHREHRGGVTIATGSCRCGKRCEFVLGHGPARLAEIVETGRWSPDVCLLLHLNDLTSGWVAGRSTALYTLVLHEVQRRVLGKRPVPVLVPPALVDRRCNEARLVYDYLAGLESVDGPAAP